MKIDQADEFYPFKKEDEIQIMNIQKEIDDRKFVEIKSKKNRNINKVVVCS